MADHIQYEVEDRVAVITLDRPAQRNAQNEQFLNELNDAWEEAASDEQVRVILLRANGPHFSSGHDLSGESAGRTKSTRIMRDGKPDFPYMYEWEARHYLGYSRRWRDIPKPSIAAVQGACIAGGLLLAWPCDLIIAADNARFSDPVVMMGLGGVEYHAHTWELGARKAKEFLFTAKPIYAEEAERLGMVNRVVPVDELDKASRELAHEIAQQEPHALALAKRSVNTTLDIMGQRTALDACFDLHEMGHAWNYAKGGQLILTGMQGIRGKA